MNSLNLLSSRIIGQTPPLIPEKTSRSRSLSESVRNKDADVHKPKRSSSQHDNTGSLAIEREKLISSRREDEHIKQEDPRIESADEKTPLLEKLVPEIDYEIKQSRLRLAAKQLVDALTESLKWVLSKLAAPGVYVVTCFYDEKGHFSPLVPLRKVGRKLPTRNGSNSTAHAVGLYRSSERLSLGEKAEPRIRRQKSSATSEIETASPVTSESDTDFGERGDEGKRHPSLTRFKTKASTSTDDTTPNRRSIRIKLKNEDSARANPKRQKKASGNTTDSQQTSATAAALKSPTSPAASLRLTKYPRAPAPPRPLIPRRQPSYSSNASPSHRSPSTLLQKTLVIDLDETLIHSLAKGGRMSSGHMVEVKLNTVVGVNGVPLGSQHPILYYVHKRPHCDDFLRKICKWYNLVVFTASVQEYADPVIDWLEQERQYFSARYYRQHCTLRNGAYIKDLSSVEPDLSRVMILDNSPLSYIFHEGGFSSSNFSHAYRLWLMNILSTDNAIPIEGWINDPTDNDLLHLIPLLEGLQYATDVRALLALRRGEAEAKIE